MESTLKFTLHQNQMVLLLAALLAVTAQHAAIALMGFACGVRILRCALSETLIWPPFPTANAWIGPPKPVNVAVTMGMRICALLKKHAQVVEATLHAAGATMALELGLVHV